MRNEPNGNFSEAKVFYIRDLCLTGLIHRVETAVDDLARDVEDSRTAYPTGLVRIRNEPRKPTHNLKWKRKNNFGIRTSVRHPHLRQRPFPRKMLHFPQDMHRLHRWTGYRFMPGYRRCPPPRPNLWRDTDPTGRVD